jgi:hypothetical protein
MHALRKRKLMFFSRPKHRAIDRLGALYVLSLMYFNRLIRWPNTVLLSCIKVRSHLQFLLRFFVCFPALDSCERVD